MTQTPRTNSARAESQIERCKDSARDMIDANGCRECGHAAIVIEALVRDLAAMTLLVERAGKERDEYKIWWERDSTALGKVLNQLSMERACKEDFRARAATLAWLEPAVEKMQRSIAFWHPGVVGNNPAFLDRAGDDAELLFGYEGPSEPSAVDLGWIVVTEAALAQPQEMGAAAPEGKEDK